MQNTTLAAAVIATIALGGLTIAWIKSPAPADPDVSPAPVLTSSFPEESPQARIDRLEAQVASLTARIAAMESSAVTVLNEITATEVDGFTAPDVTSQIEPALTGNQSLDIFDGLIAAGVEPYVAEELIRADNQVQLQRLELQDAARREGYIGTERFREEMRELRAAEVDIRKQVGEDAYDKYLFHTGQANRIRVDSIIMGSAAEASGIQSGDVILRYESQRLFNWNDLRGATSGGERGELVNVTVSRNGNELNLTMPRGPLGVRLAGVRQKPAVGG